MPMERMSMRHVRDCPRLKNTGISTREIARRVGIASSTVRLTLRRCEAAGIAWPLASDLTDAVLEQRLFANSGTKQGHRRHEEANWAAVHREMKRKHVILAMLWEEYIERHPDGYRYSRFCELYREWEGRLPVTMRQTRAAGERLFVDYAGDGVPVVVDRLTGEIRMAQIFVAVLGASSFTFARATWTRALPDWIDAHVHAFAAIGGVPRLLVPDNTKTAVIKACLYDPRVNRTYAEMAAHYATAIPPARPRRPRDKAKVEQAVLIAERWLLGRLCRRTFHSLAEVNAAIGEPLMRLNEARPIRRLGVTRRKLLEEIDRPALKVLPIEPYEYCEWRACRVGVDYHVDAGLPLLQRALSLRPRRGRGAADRADRRDFPQGRADRRAYADERQPQAHDHSRAYALRSSALRGLDDRAHPAGRAPDWAGDGGAVRADPREQAPSRAGLSRLSRHRSPRRPLWRRTGRSRRRTRHRDRRENLWLGQIHPRQQARSASRAKARRGRGADPAPQYPQPALLDLAPLF